MDYDDARDDEIMRAEEVWKMLRIGRNTLYNLVRQGLIPCKKIGRVLRFQRKELNRWLESHNLEG